MEFAQVVAAAVRARQPELELMTREQVDAELARLVPELVVDQVNGVSAVRQAHLHELHEVASGLRAGFKSFRISWVPREWNAEADQLVRDALGALD